MSKATEAEVIDEFKKAMSKIPQWVYWAIAIFGVGAIIAFIVYAWYLKRKEGAKP